METWPGHWFEFIETVGVVGSLCFATIALRSEAKTRRVSNLLAITANHREVWKIFLHDKKLARVRNAAADTTTQPITDAERVFVSLVIQHIHSVYRATSDELVVRVEGLRQDIWQFFALPIPSAIWEKIKALQNDDFVAFVESCRNEK